jgi:hypothetical protein
MSAIKSKYRDNCFFLDIQEEVAKHSSTIYWWVFWEVMIK